MRDAAHVPELQCHVAALSVHRVDHGFPAGDLGLAVDARSPGIALALLRDLRGLTHDEPGAGALGVVGGIEWGGGIAGAGSGTCHRRHDDAIVQTGLADLNRGKENCVAHGNLHQEVS